MTKFVKVPPPPGLRLKTGVKPENTTFLSHLEKVWKNQNKNLKLE